MADDFTTADPMIETHPTLPPKRKYVFPLVVLAVLVGGLFIGTKLSQQEQRPTPKATVANGAAQLSLSSVNSVILGQELPVTINLSAPETISGSTQDGIAGVRAVVSYDNTQLELAEANIEEGLSNGWTYPIKEFATNGTITTVTVEGAYISGVVDGYTGASSISQVFATLHFQSIGEGGGQLALERSSQVFSKGDNRMVLDLDNLQGTSYSINSGNNPTPTDVPEPSATPIDVVPSPTPEGSGGADLPTPTVTVTPVPPTGTPNSCGGTCGSNANCASNLICINSYCRNPQCTASTSCTCSGPTATPTVRVSGPTATPRPLATRTPTPRITLRPTTVSTPLATGDPNNPFLGGNPIENIAPTTVPPVASPAVNEPWWTRLIKAIIAFVKSIFGRK